MISFPLVTFAILAGFSPYGKIYENDIDRKKWVGRLYQDQFKGRYRRIMTPLLDRIDTALSTDETTRNLGPHRVAWSHRLLIITMLLAVAYPILAVVLQWLTGAAVTFGGETVLEAGTPQARSFVGLWLGASLLLYFLAARLRSVWRMALFIAATLILFGGQYVSGTFNVPNAGAVAVAGAVEKRDSKYGPHPKRMIALICIYLFGLTLAVRFGTFGENQGFATSAFVILFLGVFSFVQHAC